MSRLNELRELNRKDGFVEVVCVNDTSFAFPVFEFDRIKTSLRANKKWIEGTTVDGIDIMLAITDIVSICLVTADWYELVLEDMNLAKFDEGFN